MPKPLKTYADKVAYNQLLNDKFSSDMQALTAKLTSGEINLGEWQVEMRAELRRMNALQLITAAGGDKSNVAPNDWLRLGTELQKQYRYLEDFANAIKAGNLSDEMILARSAMYAESSKASFWRQLKKDVDLPAMPGDGSTICLTNCGCTWSEDNRWQLGKIDNCETCLQRASEWNPYSTGDSE